MTNNKFIGYKSLPDLLHIFLQTFCLPKQTINDVETKTINYSLTKQTKSNKISCHQSLIPFAEDVIYTVDSFLRNQMKFSCKYTVPLCVLPFFTALISISIKQQVIISPFSIYISGFFFQVFIIYYTYFHIFITNSKLLLKGILS